MPRNHVERPEQSSPFTVMGCCGEPNVPDGMPSHIPSNRQLIDQQPNPHPGAQIREKPTFQPPGLTAPTPTLPYSQNSYQPQQPSNWGQHSPSPPPVNQFG